MAHNETTAAGPELRVFVPLDADEMPKSYLPSDFLRSEAHEQAKFLLEQGHPELRLEGSAKATRIGGDGLDQGLPSAYGFLFTYRTVHRAAVRS